MSHEDYYHAADLGRFAELATGAPESVEEIPSLVRRRLRRGCAHQPGEGAHRARRGARGAVSLLHRCLHDLGPGEGSNVEQMTEAIHVAAAIRGGASLVHGVQMRNSSSRLGM